MQNQSGGSFVTLLMFVPLIAVPAFAIFGIPEFSAAVSSKQTEGDDFATDAITELGEPDFAPGSTDASSANTAGSQDSFGPNLRTRPQPHSAAGQTNATQADRDIRPSRLPQEDDDRLADLSQQSTNPAFEQHSGQRTRSDLVRPVRSQSDAIRQLDPSKPSSQNFASATGDQVDQSRPSAKSTPALSETFGNAVSGSLPNDAATNLPSAGTVTANGALTWRSAVRRLNALGIRHFQLEPGQSDNSFHFRCTYTPPATPRVTHRFEAEADEPLEAVRNVLDQVDHWRKHRPANSISAVGRL